MADNGKIIRNGAEIQIDENGNVIARPAAGQELIVEDDAVVGSLEAEITRSKKEPVANIKSYGAVGDGETDDSQAIIDAVDAVNGGVVYVPPGDYLVDELVFDSTDTAFELVGNAESRLSHIGKDLDEDPETWLIKVDELDGVTFRNITFNGNLDAHTFTGSPGNANSELLEIDFSSEISVIGCKFTEPLAGDAIDIDGTPSVRDCNFINNEYDGSANDSSGEFILGRGRGHTIIGNRASDSNSSARAAISIPDGSGDTSIIGNVIKDSTQAFEISGDNVSLVGNKKVGSFERLDDLTGVNNKATPGLHVPWAFLQRNSVENEASITFDLPKEFEKYKLEIFASVDGDGEFNLRLDGDSDENGEYFYWEETGTKQASKDSFLIADLSTDARFTGNIQLEKQGQFRIGIENNVQMNRGNRVNGWGQKGSRDVFNPDFDSVELIAPTEFTNIVVDLYGAFDDKTL